MIMRRLLLLAAPLLFAACSPPATTTTTTAAETTATMDGKSTPQTPECTATASRDWRVGGQVYRIEGHASGATCTAMNATITLSTPEGTQLFTQSYPTAQIPLAFAPVGDATTRQTELTAWLANVAPAPATANALPAWPTAAAKPLHFTPAPGVTRETYQAARAARQPIFCYPDGGESNACLALDATAHTATLLGSRTPESAD